MSANIPQTSLIQPCTASFNQSIIIGCYCWFCFKQCNRTVSLDALYSQVIHEPKKLAVIGSGCSVATEPAAEVSHYYNVTQVSLLYSYFWFGNYCHAMPPQSLHGMIFSPSISGYQPEMYTHSYQVWSKGGLRNRDATRGHAPPPIQSMLTQFVIDILCIILYRVERQSSVPQLFPAAFNGGKDSIRLLWSDQRV